MTRSKAFGLRAIEAELAWDRSADPSEKARLRRLSDLLRRLQLRAAAQALKERYSAVQFYAERAKGRPNYWRELAQSAVNA